ncbi:MAG TPA: hypothetical protein PKC76_12415 [Saprospiraceae bacterium]|nr:hypothetical protein [Saprospiraceae bacterium]HMP24932.1 hypothetical protein [Saprospiraceae bacterium]
MRNSLIIIILLAFSDLLQAQQSVQEQSFIRQYEGSIDGKYAISMHLVNWENGIIMGDYYYKKVGKKITLYGEFTDIDVFVMNEYADEGMSGEFSGMFTNPFTIKGTWTSADGKRNLPFTLQAPAETPENTGWDGQWHFNDVWDGGSLLIGSVTKDSLSFALSVVRSAHIGEIWGTAARRGNEAVFRQVEFAWDGEENPEPCYLIFNLQDDYIQVEQQSSSMACGFGMRAYATGRFDNRIITIKPTLSYGPDDADIFTTQQQHDIFRQAVGDEIYELFAYNMQSPFRPEQSSLDGFQATVVQGAVQGMFSVNEAIIMYDKTGKFWAATIDNEGDDYESSLVIRYYTNNTKHALKWPQTIGNWIDNFPDYPVRHK